MKRSPSLRLFQLAVVPFDTLAQREVSSVPSSLHDQFVARSGTIDCRLVCAGRYSALCLDGLRIERHACSNKLIASR
jgi:hypothetical protein